MFKAETSPQSRCHRSFFLKLDRSHKETGGNSLQITSTGDWRVDRMTGKKPARVCVCVPWDVHSCMCSKEHFNYVAVKRTSYKNSSQNGKGQQAVSHFFPEETRLCSFRLHTDLTLWTFTPRFNKSDSTLWCFHSHSDLGGLAL